jgi:hypothetical protein
VPFGPTVVRPTSGHRDREIIFYISFIFQFSIQQRQLTIALQEGCFQLALTPACSNQSGDGYNKNLNRPEFDKK